MRVIATIVGLAVLAGCAAEPEQGAASVQAALTASACNSPSWVQGKQYAAGSVVTYSDGLRYIAKFANPGYDPTISTYYWAPSQAANVPAWVRGARYETGAVVTYTDGNVYIAKFANPGYDPTISTYFWAPFRCNGTDPAAPPPLAPAPSTNLPSRIVGGYFTTWDFRNDVTLRSVVDTTSYNLIYIAFAVGVTADSGALHLDVPAGALSAADFKSQVMYANSKGKKIIVSVGGWYDLPFNSWGYRLDTSSKVDQFMTSMRDFQSNWGFNGMDWDLEHGDRTDTAGIVDASRRMKSEFGSSWVIASAPGVNVPSWVGTGGILDTLGSSGWDLVGEQVYGWDVPESNYQLMIVDRMTVLSNKYGANKVLLGTAYKSDVPGVNFPADPQNNAHIATTKAALATLRSAGINPRGAFVWTVQTDADASYQWQGPNGVGGDLLSHP